MKKIKLTQSQFALIDDSDHERISKYKWFAQWTPGTKSFYARRSEYLGGGRKNPIRKYFWIHREIMNCPKGMVVDHINHDTLDNRKQNLRICTQSKNTKNLKGAYINSKSGIRGVTWEIDKKRWHATITNNGLFINLGRFKNKTDAIKAYAVANKKYFGQFGGNLI